MALFLSCKRANQTIFLEPNEADRIQTSVDVIADLIGKNPDEVALSFGGKQLSNEHTFKDAGVSHGSAAVVEPIVIHVICKDGDAWEEPHADDISPPAVEEVEPQDTAEDGEPAEQTTAEAKE